MSFNREKAKNKTKMQTAKQQVSPNSLWVAVRRRCTSTLAIAGVFLFVVSVSAVLGAFSYTRGGASAATSSTLNFQARLLSNTGTTVPDGSYNIEFNLYTVPTAGTSQWTEDRLVSATQGVTVKNGYLSVSLGSITAFPGSIAWDQEQYLGMTVRGTGSCAFGACTPTDSEMTPRFKLTAVPYAFRAGAVTNAAGTTAFTADDLIQKGPSSAQVINLALAAIRINQTGAGGLLQLQGAGSDVFTVDNTGATTIKGAVLAKNTANSTGAFDIQDAGGSSYLKVDTLGGVATFGASGTSQTLLQAGTGGVQINSGGNVSIGAADATATLLVVDTKNTAGDPAGTNGAMYYNSVLQKFRCYENGVWTDCIAGGSYDGTSASFVGGLQNVPANSTALPIENMVFTTSTAISNIAASGGFTAPANGSFRSCLVMNTANVTAGTISLRWRVNGVSVGSPVCTMAVGATARQATTVLNPDVVTFNAGDIIDLAFDTSNTFLPAASNDFTVYWNVDYTGTAGSSAGDSLQDVYNQSVAATIQTANNKDIKLSLANTTVDSNFVIDIESGSDSRFILQNAGAETFGVSKDGSIVTSGGITLGTSSSTTAGTIRWTGTDFEGYDGATWLSLTTGGGGGGGVGQNMVSIVKAANETVNGSAALQDDDNLTFAIGPNETWSYSFKIHAISQAAPDIQFAVGAPVGATCRYAYEDSENAITAAQFGCGATTGLIAGDGLNNLYEVTGTVQNGATAGNVTLRWAQNTANASNTIVYAGSYVQAVRSIGAGSAGQPFAQSGNSFGALAVLGTSDNNALSVITNNVERIRILATGETRFADDVIANGTATGTTGTTAAAPGVATTTVLLAAAGGFANNDVIYIDNAGQDYYTRIVSGGGTTTLTVSPLVSYDASAAVTKYTVQNIGATTTDYSSQANRFFQGYFTGGVIVGAGSTTLSDGNLSRTNGDIAITPGAGGAVQVAGTLNATTITGDGSGITSISAASISSGTVADSNLSSNVALLNSAQTFSVSKNFGAGLTVAAGQSFTLNGTNFTDLVGTGLSVSSGVLQTTLGTSVDLTSEVTGTLTITNGGTGAGNQQDAINALSGLTTNGDLLYYDGSNTSRLARGGNGQCLTSNGTTLVWASCTTGAVTSIGTLDSQTKSANGSVIAAGTLVLQTADATNAGLIGTSAQTFAGDKTFNGQIIGAAGLSLSGTTTINTSGTDTTSIGNATGALTFTGGSASTFVIDGATIGAAELTLLDGKDAALVDINDGVTTAITGTGALTAGSIGGSFGNINIGANIFTGNGSGLTTLSGSSISSGTIANTYLTNSGALTVTAGNGLSGGGSVALGGTTTLNVAYGSAANTAVQGDTTVVCASGSGNLTGGGNTITLGTGGTCSGISTNNAVSFTTSVTTPIVTSSAGLTLSSGGAGALTLDSASNTIIIAASDTTLQRTAAGATTIDLADAGATTLSLTNSAAGAASLNLVDGNLQTAGTNRLTSAGALQNITGLTIASGGASVTGSSSFADATSLNGNVTIGDAGTDRITINSQILGANALVFQGATDNGFATTFTITDPTANNTITVPNQSGTVTLIGSASAQVDATTNSSLFINKTGATGAILTLQDNGAGVFTIGNDGATVIQTTSTAALNIKNTGGTDYFIVDTSNSLVRVGSATPDATATVLISDAKNTTGDPTGAAATIGAQYYNSFWQQYRCYRDGKWETCGINPIDRAFAIEDEFISGTTVTNAACAIATMATANQNWTCFAGGNINTAYNVGAILPTVDHPGIMRMTTSAANGNGFTLAMAGNNSGSVVLAPQNRVKASVGQGATITNNRMRIGLHAQTTTNVRPTTGVWWEADATTNANWNYCYGTGAAATCASSGIAIVASTLVSLDIQVTATGAGVSAATFTINGTAFNVSAVTISTAARVNPAISCFNSTGAARECFVDYYQFSGVAAARR